MGVALLFALGVAAPLLLCPRDSQHAPRFTTFGLLLALLGTAILPLLMFLTYARTDRGPLGVRRGGSLLLRYPLATFLALLIVPLGVVFAEGFVTLFMVWQADFRFLLLELFPGSEYYAPQHKIEVFGNYTRPYLPDPRFYHLYFRRLHQGYAFVSALPASLSCKTSILTSPWTLELTDAEYLQMRVKNSLVVTLILLLFLALQARWLGAISTMESKQHRSKWSPERTRRPLRTFVVPWPPPGPSRGRRARSVWDNGREGLCGPESKWSPRSCADRR